MGRNSATLLFASAVLFAIGGVDEVPQPWSAIETTALKIKRLVGTKPKTRFMNTLFT